MLKASIDLLKGPRRLEPGTLWPLALRFAEHLMETGHTLRTVSDHLIPARRLAAWLEYSRIAPSEIDEALVERFLECWRWSATRKHSESYSRRYVRHLRRFIRFLIGVGVIHAPMKAVTRKRSPPLDDRVSEYLDWLKRHRGLSEHKITVYGREIMKLLPSLGTNPSHYNAGLIRRVIFEKAKQHPASYVKDMATTLRGYLRFLVTLGVCPPGIDASVPTIAHWRLSSLPRYIPIAEVEALIQSCNIASHIGKRDKAILLLLARLGLRAGDIQMMRFDDVDWDDGTLRLCGKGRRETRLPLPQDAGDALLDYLNTARPCVNHDRIFLGSVAPYQPFADPCVVSSVVDRALTRAGISGAPSRGTNLLRHSAATAMLRAGATLDAVGTILRHRSADTTVHYAKVDFRAMLQIV
jgi:integrase/recombinase XerD